MAYSWVPTLGLVLYLLKNSASDFFRFHQSHRQSLSKLQSLDQLPPEELKEVTMTTSLPFPHNGLLFHTAKPQHSGDIQQFLIMLGSNV